MNLLATFIITLALSVSANAGGLWSMVKNSGITVVQPITFVLEVEGVNIRGYSFTPLGMPNTVCVSLWGGKSASHQLECKSFTELGITSLPKGK